MFEKKHSFLITTFKEYFQRIFIHFVILALAQILFISTLKIINGRYKILGQYNSRHVFNHVTLLFLKLETVEL